MTTKRIRCSCGRVYDPVKRPECPDCGAPHTVAEPAAPIPVMPAPAPDPRPPIPPPPPSPLVLRAIMIGAAAVLLLGLVFALSRCGSHKPEPAPQPVVSPSPNSTTSRSSPPAPTATAAPTVSAQVPTPNFVPPPFGSAESRDLSAMIASAAPGATIKISPGIYPGGLVISKAVRLVGVVGQVFVQSDGRECLSVRAGGVAVQNVQFICNGIGELPAISVAEDGALELDGCKINSTSAVGVSVVGGKASIKAIGSGFVALNGKAMRLDQGARGHFTQCSFGQSHHGLVLENGATAELHSCVFDADGGNDADGGIALVKGAKTTFTADDCHFTNNTSGVGVVEGATLKISNSSFKGNGVAPREGAALGLIALNSGAQGTLANDIFESNRQGVLVSNGSTLEMEKCRFTKNGGESRQFLSSCQPLSVYGKGALATVRQSVIADSEQAGAYIVGEGKLILADTEISGSNNVGVLVGDSRDGRGQVEIRGSHFLRNALGLGVLAGSSATVEGSEFRENQDGILLVDAASRFKASKLTFASNSENGINVRGNAHANVTDSDFQANARGAASGTRGKASERGSLTLEDCRFSGNRTFGAGAYAQSELILTRCVFDGSDKTNVYKDRGAMVQNDAAPPTDTVQPIPAPSGAPKPVPAPEAENGAEDSPSPSARNPSRPRATPSRKRPDDAARILRRLFRHP